MKKIAAIVSTIEEFQHIKSRFSLDNLDILVSDYRLFAKMRNAQYSLFYFYEKELPNFLYVDIFNIADCWYRDDSGRDRFFDLFGISIAQLIHRRVTFLFSRALKYYFALSNIFAQYDCIYLQKNNELHTYFKPEQFFNNIQYYTSKNTLAHFPDKAKISNYSIHKLSGVARKIQKFFIPFLRGKINIMISDWSYENLPTSRNTLRLNAILPWKGYYLKYKQQFLKKANLLFPSEIPEKLYDLQHFKKILSKNSLLIDIRHFDLFYKIAEKVYTDAREKFVMTWAIFEEMISYYRPQKISVPSSCHYAYLIIAQLARIHKIHSTLLLDGMEIFVDRSTDVAAQSSQIFVTDSVAIYDPIQKLIWRKKPYFLPEFTTMKAPFLYFDEPPSNQAQVDAVILFPVANLWNPTGSADKEYQYIAEALLACSSLGYSNVVIKWKPGGEKNNLAIFTNYLLELKENFDELNINIQAGRFSDICFQSDIFIGPISSSMVETNYLSKHYYIYDPDYLGRTMELIDSSPFLEKQPIARDIDTLLSNIRAHAHFDYTYPEKLNQKSTQLFSENCFSYDM